MSLALAADTLAQATDARVPQIPLREGLTVVTAISGTRGDYETVKQVTEIGSSSLTIVFSGDIPGGDPITATRPVRHEDLRQALEYRNFFNADDTRPYPGTTALGPSVAVLAALEGEGETPFTCYVRRGQAYRSARGVLRRVGVAAIPVLVNGSRMEVEAVRAHAELESAEGEFWFLNHPEQPLTLRYRLQRKLPPEYDKLPPQLLEHVKLEPEVLEVVKIEFPVDVAEEPLEEALERTGRAEVYGIYFDFGSDTLKAESDAVLERISGLLARHPEWRLAIEGHTDSIGGDTYNLDLSKRRAAAVEWALVERYGIAADRLSIAGFGATRPKESNDTLAGRARNRRVELVRQQAETE